MNTNGSKYLWLDPGKPCTIQLKFPEPKTVSGRYGPQLLWFLGDGRLLFTPLIVREQLEQLALKPHQPFVIEKRKNGERTEWRASLPRQPAAAILEGAESLDLPFDEIPRTRLHDALRAAVNAAAIAEKHAEQIGYGCRFDASDIREMAISVLKGAA